MARVKFGDTEFNGVKYDRMISKIAGWEKRYKPEVVWMLVQESLRTTRSPARATALKEWMLLHPEIEKE